jgi:hypothetical protein
MEQDQQRINVFSRYSDIEEAQPLVESVVDVGSDHIDPSELG